ncbi:MAG: ferredoxin [Bacteroidota bacterium]|nr:ferredoxin [Bacteroidota bacterium]
MVLTNVWIEDGCTSCGICEALCPEVFLVEDLSTVIDDVNYSEYDAKIREAADSCPVQVIKFSE